MSTTLTAEARPAEQLEDDLAQLVALIACGTREGKTRGCDKHRAKGPALLRIAQTGALDALAAAICHSNRGCACSDCVAKARAIHTAIEEAGL